MEPRINEELQLVSLAGKMFDRSSLTAKYYVQVKYKRKKEMKWMDERTVAKLK
jgi:hypothetical protein